MGQNKKIPFVIGSSFHVAPLEMLERLAVGKDELHSVVKEMSGWVQIEDLVLLSTCNRTEIIGTTDDMEATQKKIVSYLNTFCGDIQILPEHLYKYSGTQAVAHLFTVVSGMDSMILGETEIVGQLQHALATSQCEGLVTNYFVQLFDAMFKTNKRVRGETQIDQGTTSVAKAGVHMAKRIVGDLSKRSVLIIGAGETGSLVCTYLQEEKATLYLSNRTVEKANTLATKVGGSVIPFADVESFIPKVDVIFLATGSKTPLITREIVERGQKKRKGDILLIVDISLPHNADANVTDVNNVFLFDMNDLKEVVTKSMSKRAGEKQQAMRIVNEEVALFFEKQRTLEVGPLIASLRASFEALGKQERTRFENRFQAEDKEVLEQFTGSLINKLLHWPTMGVRELANDNEASFEKAKWFEKMFGLDKNFEERKNKK